MGSSDILTLITPLIIISVLLFGVLWLVKRASLPGRGKAANKVAISVLSTYQLMPKKFLSLVKVEDKIFLLGISDHSINLIKELDMDPADFDVSTVSQSNTNFMEFFKSALKNK